MGKKKKVLAAKAQAKTSKKLVPKRGTKEERRAHKLERRKKEKRNITADMWRMPAPSHLVAKLDVPKVKSKYQSYFEFADNPEKKQKKLEYSVTKDANPPPGFVFVPIGDPVLTNCCKELSRERDAMIFIVSSWKEENSKISEHVHRTGYHFRESIVDEAREIIGETVISNPTITPGFIEPIPESQDEINKQADGAIRDLFPRIPNTDRQMIIEHAFKKGAMFHGEPTVGLQPEIPLSRRVQLAVLAHIRHTHTRYDKLLRETTWMNARKAVEPVCLDVLVKWRGDEETGRDQMDEILREVVIITDSEDDDDSSEDETSEEEGEVTSDSSPEAPSEPNSHNMQRSLDATGHNQSQSIVGSGHIINDPAASISSRTRAKTDSRPQKDKKAQRGFKRYQAAWEDAVHRRQDPTNRSITAGTPSEDPPSRNPHPAVPSPRHGGAQFSMGEPSCLRPVNPNYEYLKEDHPRHHGDVTSMTRVDPYPTQYRPIPGPLPHRGEVIVRPLPERPVYYQELSPRLDTSPYPAREQQKPSQVVRRSPTRLEDCLVPSIETTSSEVSSPFKDRPYAAHERLDPSQNSYPRRVIDHRMQSPAPRQVIVINDDSPQIKRRRVVIEDDPGRFRLLPPQDHSLNIPTQNYDSHLTSASSAHSGDLLVQRSRVSSQATQGMSRDSQPMYTDPATAERLPIYDAPKPDYFLVHPENFRRVASGQRSHQREDFYGMSQMGTAQPTRDIAIENPQYQRPVNEYRGQEMRITERDRGVRQAEPQYVQRPVLPKFPESQKFSRSDMGPGSEVADQDFIQSFSQSRLDGPLSRTRDGFTALPENSHQNFVSQSNVPLRYMDSNRSFATIPSSRARSPVRYLDRPVQYREETRQPIYHEIGPPHSSERYASMERPPTTRGPPEPPLGGEPMYIRTIEPGRQVYVRE